MPLKWRTSNHGVDMRPVMIFLLLPTLSCSREADSKFIVAGALRNSGSGWTVIDDADHAPINLRSASHSTTEIRIFYGRRASAVHSLIVGVDETLATRRGLVCGASAGLESAKIQCSARGDPAVVDPNALTDAWGNLWVYGVFAQ